MTDDYFTVTWPRSHKIILPVFGFLIVALLILTMIDPWGAIPDVSIAGVTVFTLFYFLIFLYASIGTWMFRVEVRGCDITVRSKWGKIYAFTCSDIRRVTCFRRDSTKFGPQFYITITTDTTEVELSHAMIGFETMAGYILRMHKSGEIRYIAASETCTEKLRQYENGRHRGKKPKKGTG